MKRVIIILIIAGTVLTEVVEGQDKSWTLGDCVTYAVENNIDLRRQKLQTETSEVNLLKSKLDLLPSLNFGSDAQLGFGRSIDPVTNLITFEQNFSNSYYLNSSIEIFNGLANVNTVAANKLMMKSGLENEKVARNQLILDITGQYFQSLYAKGVERASRFQLDLSERQLFRIKRMVETGKEAVSKQYEMESRVSTDRLNYTVAQNNTNQALTTLKQMLQLEAGSQFDIVQPELDTVVVSTPAYDTDSVFSIASQVLPRLRAIEYELEASKKQFSAAKGYLLPSIEIGGRIYTGYYQVLNEGAPTQDSFSDQLRNNNSQAIYLSLAIPIFNNYVTGKNVKLARIRMNDTELKLELEKNNLYSEVENACLDFNRGIDEHAAAVANLAFNKKSFTAVEKKFESGLVDVTDYSAAHVTLFRAETEALRTKLQVMFRKLTIQFITTGDYEYILSN
ncbi:MAG: TolC family protein [Bacteroidales bacterium]|jgi:outer membrane protein|nr:TolC family protein [Bacteroidales bacterium]